MNVDAPAPSRTLHIKAATAELGQVRRFVEEAAQLAGLETERVFDLKVAVSEACANAIAHAGTREDEMVKVCAGSDGHRLTITVSDGGVFRPPVMPRDEQQNLGLGLPLMVALMDEVRFSKAPQGGTVVSLSVAL